ncbi:MAG: helix-turn-helix domain-containing protein [Salinirussus sp.]
MPRATLSITVPERVWVGDLTRRHPESLVRVLSAYTEDDVGVGLAEIESPDIEAILASIQDYDDVQALEVLRRSDEMVLIQFETGTPLLLLPLRDSGVSMELPIEIRDGAVTWHVTAPRDRLSALRDQLQQFDVTYRVEAVHERVEDEPLLTERQRRLVTAAVEAGYYDTPREATLTELANDLGIAKSTASETLHRAEGRIIKEFVDGTVTRHS